MYIYICTYLTVYELLLLPNNTASGTFYTNRKRCEVFTGCLSLRRLPGRLRDIGQSVLQPYQTGSSSSPNYCHSFFLTTFFEDAFDRNVISLLCINYNNAVINNNYGRLQDLILVFKIPMGTWKDFFEICKQLRHAPSKWIASPAVGPTLRLHYG